MPIQINHHINTFNNQQQNHNFFHLLKLNIVKEMFTKYTQNTKSKNQQTQNNKNQISPLIPKHKIIIKIFENNTKDL